MYTVDFEAYLMIMYQEQILVMLLLRSLIIACLNALYILIVFQGPEGFKGEPGQHGFNGKKVFGKSVQKIFSNLLLQNEN